MPVHDVHKGLGGEATEGGGERLQAAANVYRVTHIRARVHGSPNSDEEPGQFRQKIVSFPPKGFPSSNRFWSRLHPCQICTLVLRFPSIRLPPFSRLFQEEDDGNKGASFPAQRKHDWMLPHNGAFSQSGGRRCSCGGDKVNYCHQESPPSLFGIHNAHIWIYTTETQEVPSVWIDADNNHCGGDTGLCTGGRGGQGKRLNPSTLKLNANTLDSFRGRGFDRSWSSVSFVPAQI